MDPRIKTGDMCWTQGIFKRHYGVCVGQGPDGELWFVHATLKGGAVETTRKGFAGNRDIRVEVPFTGNADDAQTVVQRARDWVGKPYDIFTANCEHLARAATTGRRESKQLQQTTAAVCLVGLLLVTGNTGPDGEDSEFD